MADFLETEEESVRDAVRELIGLLPSLRTVVARVDTFESRVAQTVAKEVESYFAASPVGVTPGTGGEPEAGTTSVPDLAVEAVTPPVAPASTAVEGPAPSTVPEPAIVTGSSTAVLTAPDYGLPGGGDAVSTVPVESPTTDNSGETQ
jgi:hypothetical protein